MVFNDLLELFKVFFFCWSTPLANYFSYGQPYQWIILILTSLLARSCSCSLFVIFYVFAFFEVKQKFCWMCFLFVELNGFRPNGFDVCVGASRVCTLRQQSRSGSHACVQVFETILLASYDSDGSPWQRYWSGSSGGSLRLALAQAVVRFALQIS